MHMTTEVDCQPCDEIVDAVRVTGAVIYPHRPDLAELILLQCPKCKNYVSFDEATGEPKAWITDAAGRRERSGQIKRVQQRIIELITQEMEEHLFALEDFH